MKLRYALSLPLYIVVWLVAMFVAPLLPIFAVPTFGPTNNANGQGVGPRLPVWLSWFQTPDNTLSGDLNFQAKHGYSYWSQVLWLWRNPAYGIAWGTLAYIPPNCAVYAMTELGGSDYRIDGSDGSFEITRYGKYFKLRLGWILGDVTPGIPALFLFPLRMR